MGSYYDEQLLSYLNEIQMEDFAIIQPELMDYISKFMRENFYFKYGRVYFTDYQNEKSVKSDINHLSEDMILFISELLEEGSCDINEKIIYIGDSLTDYGYEFYLYNLLKVIPYLMNNIPQHHYFLFRDGTKLMYASFENEIQFGMREIHNTLG